MIWMCGKGFYVRLRAHDETSKVYVEGFTHDCVKCFIGESRLGQRQIASVLCPKTQGEPHWQLTVERSEAEQCVIRHMLTVWPKHLKRVNLFEGMYDTAGDADFNIDGHLGPERPWHS